MRFIHTSDVHLFAGRPFAGDLAMVRGLAATARRLAADLVVVAGDLFDHNRVPGAQAGQLMSALAEPGVPLVVLPGNHDPLTPGSIFRRLDLPRNLHVLGLDGPTYVVGGWTVTGRAHLDYADFGPLAEPFGDQERGANGELPGRIDSAGERIVLAHGHYDLGEDAGARHRPGWLITAADLERTPACYVALGHWDRAYQVRADSPAAWYSGSPWHAGSVNVVTVGIGKPVQVERAPIGEASRGR